MKNIKDFFFIVFIVLIIWHILNSNVKNIQTNPMVFQDRIFYYVGISEIYSLEIFYM